MAKKRKKFIPIYNDPLFSYGNAKARQASSRIVDEIANFYSENVHITRSIDERLCKMSAKWCKIPQRERYQWIHQGLGVKWLFDLAENDMI